MLEKIIRIKGIGRVRDDAANGDLTFRTLTLVHAENSRGKPTLGERYDVGNGIRSRFANTVSLDLFSLPLADVATAHSASEQEPLDVVLCFGSIMP